MNKVLKICLCVLCLLPFDLKCQISNLSAIDVEMTSILLKQGYSPQSRSDGGKLFVNKDKSLSLVYEVIGNDIVLVKLYRLYGYDERHNKEFIENFAGKAHVDVTRIIVNKKNYRLQSEFFCLNPNSLHLMMKEAAVRLETLYKQITKASASFQKDADIKVLLFKDSIRTLNDSTEVQVRCSLSSNVASGYYIGLRLYSDNCMVLKDSLSYDYTFADTLQLSPEPVILEFPFVGIDSARNNRAELWWIDKCLISKPIKLKTL